jgi:hypothetical protein
MLYIYTLTYKYKQLQPKNIEMLAREKAALPLPPPERDNPPHPPHRQGGRGVDLECGGGQWHGSGVWAGCVWEGGLVGGELSRSAGGGGGGLRAMYGGREAGQGGGGGGGTPPAGGGKVLVAVRGRGSERGGDLSDVQVP